MFRFQSNINHRIYSSLKFKHIHHQIPILKRSSNINNNSVLNSYNHQSKNSFYSTIRFYNSNQQQQQQQQQSNPKIIQDNLKHISQTAKVEVSKTFESVLDSVSGINHQSQNQHHQNKIKPSSSAEIISDLNSLGSLYQVVPKGAIIFGVAGLMPYFATSLTTIYLSRQVYLSTNNLAGKFDTDTALTLLYHNENIQVAYGAVILSFLGAIHWGIEFATKGMMSSNQKSGPEGSQRYILGIIPVILAWPTLLLPGQLALASQWAAFTIVWYTDMLATGWGWTPRWYSTYRFGLTAIVGGSIIITLAATNYWTTDQGSYLSTSRKLQELREKESFDHHHHEEAGTGGLKVEGSMGKDAPVGSVSGDDAFVRITDVAAEKREEKARAMREKKKKEMEKSLN